MTKEKNYKVSVFINGNLKDSKETGKMYDAHIKAFYIKEDFKKQFPYAEVSIKEAE